MPTLTELNIGQIRPTPKGTWSATQAYKYTHTAIDLKNTNAQTGSITHAEGEYTIPLRGLNTAIKVTIESDAYTSESFISADWQGNFITKVKNI